jgi:anthranilate 1,2-dioxygenase ferredoxin reductase component
LIGSEPGLPYDRPTLTKSFLLKKKHPGELLLKQADAYDALGIRYRPETTVEAIDPARGVASAAGEQFPYDALLLATGSRSRRLPADLVVGDGLYLRSLADAQRLDDRLCQGARVVVIGGGFIGLEVASAARSRGCSVTVVEAQERVMSRGMPAVASTFMSDLHEANGVQIRCGERVRSIAWRRQGGAEIELASETLSAELVVYGLGIEPNVELAESIGLDVADGIVVDAGCRTSDPAIFAAGEVTSHPSGRSGRHRRIESWRVASDQPLVAAANMTGGAANYRDPPWLWSDQYDVNLQVLGDLLSGKTHILHGRLDEKKWTLIALDAEGLPVGAVAINNGRDISMLRRAIHDGTAVPSALAAECRPFPGVAGLRYARAGA